MTLKEELWDFPHAMTLKVMGAAESPLEQAVIAILDQHLNGFNADTHITTKPSSKGNYISVSARVVMENKEQVLAIYAALDASPHVKVVF